MITTDTISDKIQLLEEQIENITHSGFFTEKEIDKLCGPLLIELEMLNNYEANNSNFIKDIIVINPEIITPNNPQS